MTRSTTVLPRYRRVGSPRRALAAFAVTSALLLAGCGGGSFEEEGGGGTGGGGGGGGGGETGEAEGPTSGDGSLQVLIASSGDAETKAVEEAAAAWAEETGNEAEVVVASDITQQLTQGFAGGNPPDVFYVDAGAFADYAANGNLYPYAADLEEFDDFYPNLVETFTLEDTTYCVPKDFSTLALQINTAAWERAGLTDDDIPTDWEELATVAERLSQGDQAGLALGLGRDRVGAFMVQNGGFWIDTETGEVTATSEENVEALQYVQDLLKSDAAVLPPEVDAGWGGEAFGTESAAMTIEGNWIRGAMEADYPDVKYTVAELPEGPAGKGTLLFTQCWGIAAESDNQEAAIALVEHLTTPEQQIRFAEAFGVMPSRRAAEQEYVSKFPDDAPFIAGAEYGQGPVNQPGLGPALADLESQLEQVERTDVEQILESFQTNAEAALQQ